MRLELVKSQKTNASNKRRCTRERIYCTFTALLPLIGFCLFGFVPILISLWMAFRQPGSTADLSEMSWNGGLNFKLVLEDPKFWVAVGDTLLNCLVTPLSMVFGLVVALIVNNPKLKGRTAFKAIFFLPYVCSVVATSSIWQMLLNPEYGPFNNFLSKLGIPPININNPSQTMPILIFLGVWSGVGFSIIMYSAALTNIDNGVIEASKIDGANAWERFWHVTFPGVMPVSFFLLITGVIGNLQDFTRFQLLVPSGSERGVTVAYYLYTKMTETSSATSMVSGIGVASAASWILTLIIMFVTAFQFIINKKQGDSSK